jgi:hypothetical protein
MDDAEFCFFFGKKAEEEQDDDIDMQEESTSVSEHLPKKVFQKPKPSIKMGNKPLSLMEMI